MPNPAHILSNPTVLSALASQWHKNVDNPSVNHVSNGRYLSPAEIMAFLLAARGDPYRNCAALLTCSLLTGICPEDLTNAEWNDVDLEAGTMIVHSKLRGDLQCHPLTKPARIFLEQWHQQVAYPDVVFTMCGEAIPLDFLQNTVKVLGHLAGIKNLTFDDLLRSHEYIALVSALVDTAPASAPD